MYHHSKPFSHIPPENIAMDSICTSHKCKLDEDDCVSLASILQAFNAPIKEEQCWALYYQLIKCLSTIRRKCPLYLLTKPRYLFICKDGYIHKKTFIQTGKRLIVARTHSTLSFSLTSADTTGIDWSITQVIGR